MSRINMFFMMIFVFSLISGLSFFAAGCFDDDDDDDDDDEEGDDDDANAGNSDCDYGCYETMIDEYMQCEIDYYGNMLNCAPTDAACQSNMGDDWDMCTDNAEGKVRDCAENCAGCLLTFNNCMDQAFNDIDHCWNGCSGNTTCQNACTAQFETDLTNCENAIDTCYSWYNKSCQHKAVDDWNTCATPCNAVSDYNERHDCLRMCTEDQWADTKACI